MKATASEPPAPPRLAFIHILRGIGALLVVWDHVGAAWFFLHHQTSNLDGVMKMLIVEPFHLYQDGGHLGVVIFFLVSGYIITHAALREDRLSFAVKRVFRILPPLLVALLAVWAYLHFAKALDIDPVVFRAGGFWHWARAALLLDGWVGPPALEVTWTLVVEVIFYSLTFMVLRLTQRRPGASTWLMTGAWAVVCIAVAAIPVLRASPNVLVPGFVGFLLVGRAIFLWTTKRLEPAVAALNIVTVLVLFASFTEHYGLRLVSGVGMPLPPVFTYFYAGIIFVGMMLAAPKRTVQPFTFLGDISYSLYLLHVPVGFLTLDLTIRRGISADVATVLAIAASIFAAWVSYVLVERPSQRLARSLLRRWRPQAPNGSTSNPEATPSPGLAASEQEEPSPMGGAVTFPHGGETDGSAAGSPNSGEHPSAAAAD